MTETYGICLFESVNHALRAEKEVLKKGIPAKLIPVPRSLSSDCGICLRYPIAFHTEVAKLLLGKLKVDFRTLP